MPTLALGSEVWQLRYDAVGNRYVPHPGGIVRGVRGDEVLLRGRWQTLGYPHFFSEADARAWCEAHPPAIPSVK